MRFVAMCKSLEIRLVIKKRPPFPKAALRFQILFYGCGVAGGVGGVAGAVVLAGGNVFKRNWSRMPALAGLLTGHCRSAAFWIVSNRSYKSAASVFFVLVLTFAPPLSACCVTATVPKVWRTVVKAVVSAAVQPLSCNAGAFVAV